MHVCVCSLACQKNGKDQVNCVYKLCPATLYGACCSILSRDLLHHCLSSNGSLENSERKLGHLFCNCRSCKTLQLYFSGTVRTLQQVFQEYVI